MAYLYNENWIDLLDFFKLNNMSRKEKQKWLEQFSSIEEAFQALYKSPKKINLITSSQKTDIRVITILDKDYPYLLKNIFDPPVILYLLGNDLKHNENLTISVIGSRHPTPYGEKTARIIVEYFKHPQVSIISGMAIGIDSIAQITALNSEMNTIAVLGSGVDVCYPRSKVALYKKLIDKGSIISEYPPGTPPKSYHFPMRNRIISGLSKKLIVAEAGLKSGTMITAQCALEQGRDVYAIPGSIFMKQSQGCHKLINDGAKILMDEEMLVSISTDFKLDLSKEEKYLLKQINQLDPNFYELQILLNIDTTKLLIELGKLESLGLLEQKFGKFILTEKGFAEIQ